MDPARDLADWPNSNLSRMIRVRPHNWHVQETGSGPLVLLIHGAGGSTHSYRDLIPLLAQMFRVVAVDDDQMQPLSKQDITLRLIPSTPLHGPPIATTALCRSMWRTTTWLRSKLVSMRLLFK